MRPVLLALGLWLGAAACSANSGTGNLWVDAEIRGKPDSTLFSVRILRQGNNVVGANVFVEDGEGGREKNLEGRGDSTLKKGEYRYEGMLSGYVRSVTLKITSGEEGLEAALDGPAPHEITRPPQNAIVRAAGSEVLTIEWDADGAAERVIVTAEGTPPLELQGDPGRAEVPLSGLPSGDQKLRIERENSLVLAGGSEGSTMRIRYEVDNRFTLER